jgi:organic radical activating enzyme
VKESWDVAAQQWMPVEDIVAEASKYPGKTIVITGGEPLMYDLTLLTEKLHEAGIRIHIETSGAYPLSGDIDWICVSPKKFKAPLPSVCSVAHELKIIVFNKSDFDWAEKYAKMVAPDCKLYLQPEWEKRAAVEPLMIDYVKNNPQWRMSVQTHKYLDIP